MKKTFKLTHEKIKPARLADAIKSEVKKYIKRERKKPLPSGIDFLDFDCRFGKDADSSVAIHQAEINKCIDQALADQLESFYLEIIATEGRRTHKPQDAKSIDEDAEFDEDFDEEYDYDDDKSLED